MRVRDDCFVKYCRAKKEKLKIYMEYKVLRNEVKMKTKQDKKTFPGFIPKKKKKNRSIKAFICSVAKDGTYSMLLKT